MSCQTSTGEVNIQDFWGRVFLFGVFGLVVVVVMSLLAVGNYSMGFDTGMLSEGGRFSKSVRVVAFWAFILAGLSLLIPVVHHLIHSNGTTSSSSRIAWTVGLVLFPFIVPYLYFFIYVRK
jgi:hypothetical protein